MKLFAFADEVLAELMERDRQLDEALTLAARLNELQTELSCVAADLDDDRLSAAVAAIRRPVLDAGNRLARLRRPV